jgi:hypothetical protein
MTPWRDLYRQLLQFTYVADVEAYADVFDAIDEARGRGRGYVPGPDERERLGQVHAAGEDAKEHVVDFVASAMPVTQVRIANAVRLCVGLLQDSVWRDAERWHLRAAQQPDPDVLLPDASALLGRKLRPTPGEVADVARFLLIPSPGFSPNQESYGEPFAAGFRFTERHVAPPAGEPVRAALVEARRRLAVAKARATEARHKSGGKPQTSRFDQWDARLARLLNGPCSQIPSWTGPATAM